MVKRVCAKVVRKEGTYHLYRCNICLRAQFGENVSLAQLKSVSFTNVRKHHASMHPNVEFVPVRSDVYYQPANAPPKLLKCFQEPMPFKLWVSEPAEPERPEPERPEPERPEPERPEPERPEPERPEPERPEPEPLDELDEETMAQLERWFSEPESRLLPSKVWPYEPHQLPFPPAPFHVEPNPEPI